MRNEVKTKDGSSVFYEITPYHRSTYPWLESRKTPCLRCGKPVTVSVEPGARRTPRKLCSDCLTADAEPCLPYYREMYTGKHPRYMQFNLGCRTFRPGDPGFQQRAAEIMASHGEGCVHAR